MLSSIEGILALQDQSPTVAEPTTEAAAQALTRRGAEAALCAVVHRLGTNVFEKAPNLWNAMAEPIVSRGQRGESLA